MYPFSPSRYFQCVTGNRIGKSVTSRNKTESAQYLWDINHGLPQVLTESDGKGTALYTYGLLVMQQVELRILLIGEHKRCFMDGEFPEQRKISLGKVLELPWELAWLRVRFLIPQFLTLPRIQLQRNMHEPLLLMPEGVSPGVT